MNYIPRIIEKEIQRSATHFPAILVTGPRRAGKTTLLRQTFPHASYVLLEDLDIIARVGSDPRGFLSEITTPVILDEIQNVPTLFNYVRTLIDAEPQKHGQWLFTGPQEAPLMKGVSESMAGRIAVFSLLPFSVEETPLVSIINGGFPEVIADPSFAQTWFRSYVQTYLERDVRLISAIGDLSMFRRFMALLATRTGSMLNRTDLAASIGMSVPGISSWLSILEITNQIILVPPFYENFGKRLVKSPKVYFQDSGLACHLLGIETEVELNRSSFLGPLFEGFVASEILKHQLNSNHLKNLYYFRDQQGLEVDFVVPQQGQRLVLIESKASRTITPRDAEPMQRLGRSAKKYEIAEWVVHPDHEQLVSIQTLRPGARATTVSRIAEILK